MGEVSLLIIDNEEIVRTCCSRALGPAGYRVELAEDGMEGLALLRQGGFDLVITDMKMPRMDGAELVGQIKRLAPGVPVMVVTGYCTEETRHAVEALGVEGYLEKPFSPSELIAAIRRILPPP